MTAITLDAIQAGSLHRPLLAHYPDGIGQAAGIEIVTVPA